ncbi:unnamed protein product, partial [Chrysoparadoxa australica]
TETPGLLREPRILAALLSLLEIKPGKRNLASQGLGSTTHERRPAQALACRVIAAALRDLPEWPLTLLDAYMKDALYARQWVEHPDCQILADNLRTAWKPQLKVANLAPLPLQDEGNAGNQAAAKPVALHDSGDSSSGEEEEVEEEFGVVGFGSVIMPQLGAVCDRFTATLVQAQDLVVKALKARLQGIGSGGGTAWQVILALAEMTAIPAVRGLAATSLGKWLQSAALSRHAMRLLSALVKDVDAGDTPEVI